jgi:hypothetical protein
MRIGGARASAPAKPSREAAQLARHDAAMRADMVYREACRVYDLAADAVLAAAWACGRGEMDWRTYAGEVATYEAAAAVFRAELEAAADRAREADVLQ